MPRARPVLAGSSLGRLARTASVNLENEAALAVALGLGEPSPGTTLYTRINLVPDDQLS